MEETVRVPVAEGYYTRGELMKIVKELDKKREEHLKQMEKRIDIIGQNGNDGLHYEEETHI